MKKVNTDKIKEFLLANPEFLNSEYAKTALLFDTNYEVIRGIARRLREKINPQHSKETTNFEENKEGFDKAKRPITIPMFRTKAWLKRIDPTMNIQKIREELVQDLVPLFDSVPRQIIRPSSYKDDDPHLLEINACDLHLGKIGIEGDRYSLDIARNRMLKALEHLVKRASGFYIDKILFVVGNDFLNSDGDFPIASTTKGTPQSNTDSHIEMYRSGRKLLVECINMLLDVSEVHVVVIPDAPKLLTFCF